MVSQWYRQAIQVVADSFERGGDFTVQISPLGSAELVIEILLEQVMPKLVAGDGLPPLMHHSLFSYQPVVPVQFLG